MKHVLGRKHALTTPPSNRLCANGWTSRCWVWARHTSQRPQYWLLVCTEAFGQQEEKHMGIQSVLVLETLTGKRRLPLLYKQNKPGQYHCSLLLGRYTWKRSEKKHNVKTMICHHVLPHSPGSCLWPLPKQKRRVWVCSWQLTRCTSKTTPAAATSKTSMNR